MNMRLWLLTTLVLFTSCASSGPQAADQKVDTELGLASGDQAAEAEQTLADMQLKQQMEQKRALERQITDPVADLSSIQNS